VAREQGPFRATATHTEMRIKVRGIALHQGRILVQKPTNDPGACYAFIGGSYEFGETLVERLAKEFAEETNARLINSRYLFVVEHQWWRAGDCLAQGLEHFFEVTLDREDIESKEAHLSQHWLPLSTLKAVDLQPWIVRDVIAEGRVYSVRHLVARLDEPRHPPEP
jgi:ADP-ribose pyrophosphatase YjhB (NUDIX family)